MDRRATLFAFAALPWPAWVRADTFSARLGGGGGVVAFRHALAPGTYDPPGFRLGACGTQRNLDDEGRAQAQRIGAWFRARRLQPSAVRSSPWCRCLDTARLAFGQAEPWGALGSPRAGSEETNSEALAQLRSALVAAARRRGRFEVWVTHQFVLSALVGGSVDSGEGLLLQAQADGSPRVLARLPVPAR
jgi:phosphohistidine phosphatase SixA